MKITVFYVGDDWACFANYYVSERVIISSKFYYYKIKKHLLMEKLVFLFRFYYMVSNSKDVYLLCNCYLIK